MHLKTTTPRLKNSMNHSRRLAVTGLLLALVLACFALSPSVHAKPKRVGDLGNGNTAAGAGALFNLTTGVNNTAVGFDALFSLTDAGYNTATGWQALYGNTAGVSNTADGVQALFSNTTGNGNTANGNSALFSNTEGDGNTADGNNALAFNTTGNFNTANGVQALFSNTEGDFNTANGNNALLHNTTGNSNTANGVGALFNNTTGNINTANGADALFNNTTGNVNTANGVSALLNNTTGDQNAATGAFALYNNTTGSHNTADGADALLGNTTGNNNIGLGDGAGFSLTTGNSNIDIGNQGFPAETQTIRIGLSQTRTFIAGIRGTTTDGADAVAVVIDSAGQLGTVSSSQRFKNEIKPMDKASESILALKPVTFHYQSDVTGTPQFGLVAEQVAKVNPDLVVRDAEGKVYSVRYEAVNAMLLNEFLKEHRKVEALEAKIAQQESANSDQQKVNQGLTTSMKEQAAQIQKVSDQLKVHKSAPRVVVNNQ